MQSIEIAVEAKCSRSGQSCLTLIERSRGNTALSLKELLNVTGKCKIPQ